MDLVKTLEEEDEVEYHSDSSKEEDDVDLRKPKTKQEKLAGKKKTSDDFDEGFQFVSTQKDYMKDTWSDMSVYMKKKANTKLNDKIAKIRKERLDGEKSDEEDEDDEEEEEDDESFGAEDWDDIKVKSQQKSKKKKKKDEATEDEGIQEKVRLKKKL